MDDEMGIEPGQITTSIMSPISMAYDGWVVLEAKQVWSDLRYRIGTDDRKTNISFSGSPLGSVLVAIPTREEPPEPPQFVEGLKVITLDEFVFAVMEVAGANEKIRINIDTQLLSDKQTF